MDWTSLLPACPILGPIVLLLLLWIRRETNEKTFWRDKALNSLGLGETAVDVAKDFAEEAT